MSEDGDNKIKEILNLFKKKCDEKYATNEEEDKEKKKIFNLVVNIMFGADQTEEIKIFNTNNNEINEKNDMQKLSVDNVKSLCNAVFNKVDQIYEKLHAIPNTKQTKEEENKTEQLNAQNKEAIKAATQQTGQQEITKIQTETGNAILEFGGSFPPPSSKKYKLIKK